MTDEITITIPRERALYGVAHLVLGGLGIRMNLTIEYLEDLQLAIDSVLDRARAGGDVTIGLRLEDGDMQVRIGPMYDGVREELDAEEGDDVGLRRILAALVDRVDVETDGAADWVKLTKSVDQQKS